MDEDQSWWVICFFFWVKNRRFAELALQSFSLASLTDFQIFSPNFSIARSLKTKDSTGRMEYVTPNLWYCRITRLARRLVSEGIYKEENHMRGRSDFWPVQTCTSLISTQSAQQANRKFLWSLRRSYKLLDIRNS